MQKSIYFKAILMITMFLFLVIAGGCSGGSSGGKGNPELPVTAPRLSSIQLSSGSLSPAFSPTNTQYSASVANSVTSVTITMAASANTSISVNGQNVTSGNAFVVSLDVGPNTITIIVRNSSGTTTYTVTVTRASQTNAVYHKISADQAVVMMSQSSGYAILDVRTETEYNTRHIRNAVRVNYAWPYSNEGNEDFKRRVVEVLRVKDQFIYVYCEAGVRSEYAARALVDLGYTNVYDFGGIGGNRWPYSSWIVSAPPPTTWADKADTSWWTSTGTNFTISTPEQFAALSSLINITKFTGQTITLTSDINLYGNDWAPISDFGGVFDGGGHTILNMRIDSSASGIGLFYSLSSGGTIRNFTLNNAEILICAA